MKHGARSGELEAGSGRLKAEEVKRKSKRK